MKNLFRNVFLSVCTLFVFSANNTLIAQSAEADFLIVIKTSEKGVELNCIQGCNFKDLKFSLSDKEVQAVNNDGMTSSISDLAERTAEAIPSDNFLFTVEKNGDGVLVKGINGTYWEKLNFKNNPNLTQAFNQNGRLLRINFRKRVKIPFPWLRLRSAPGKGIFTLNHLDSTENFTKKLLI